MFFFLGKFLPFFRVKNGVKFLVRIKDWSKTIPKILTKHSTSTKPWVRTRSKINPPKDVKFLFSGCGANLRALEGGTEGASREQLFESLWHRKIRCFCCCFLNAAFKDVCLEIQVKYEDSVMEKTGGSLFFVVEAFAQGQNSSLKALQRMDWLHPGPVMQKDLKKVACLGPSISWFWWLIPLNGGGFGGVIVQRDEQILYIGCLFQGKRWSGPKSKLYWVDWPSYCNWYWCEEIVTPGNLFICFKIVVRSIGEQDENRHDRIWALVFQIVHMCCIYTYMMHIRWDRQIDRQTDRQVEDWYIDAQMYGYCL